MLRHIRMWGWVACVVAASTSLAFAQAPARNHDIEVEDYFSLATPTECAVSPDGAMVAYTELRWDKDADGRNQDLWVVETRTKAVTRLTFDSASDASPEWSPDGKYIYFASNRKRPGDDQPPYDGTRQVWRASPSGGELFPLTRVKGGVGEFHFSKDGKALYYAVGDEQYDDDFKELRTKHSDLEYGHGVAEYTQIWRLDLATWRAKKLVDQRRVVREFVVAPDESYIAMITTPDDTLMSNEGWSRVDVWKAATNEIVIVNPDGWRKEHASPYGWLGSLVCSNDGTKLAWTIDFDGYPGEIFVGDLRDAAPRIWKLDRPYEESVAGGLHWIEGESNSALAYLAENHARRHVYYAGDVEAGKQNPQTVFPLTPGDVVVHGYSQSADGRVIAFIMNDKQNDRDIYQMTSDARPGAYKRLTRLNPQVATWKLPQMSIVSWTSPDGTTVEGILELPPDYKEGDGPLPLVVELHGGPTAATMFALRFWIYGRTLMAAKGYALLSPNYRGSTGYGDKFMTDLVGHENEIEVADILAGVDAMVERGIADPDRLGVMGWSNGGFLTNCLITKTDRFKAASSGAGILDMVLQWASEDTPGHVINYMQGLPWVTAAAYEKASPVYVLGNVTTPTLIHVGGSDPRCPPAHSKGLYRALKYYVKVPAELVIYPGAGHSVTTYKHRKAKMEWDLAWFEKYLKGNAAPNEKKE